MILNKNYRFIMIWIRRKMVFFLEMFHCLYFANHIPIGFCSYFLYSHFESILVFISNGFFIRKQDLKLVNRWAFITFTGTGIKYTLFMCYVQLYMHRMDPCTFSNFDFHSIVSYLSQFVLHFGKQTQQIWVRVVYLNSMNTSTCWMLCMD